jgi:hypothetical protein
MQQILSNIENQQFLYSHETDALLWIDKWMEQKRLELRLNSWEGYKIYLEKHIRPYFESKKLTLSKLSPQHLQDYFKPKIKGRSFYQYNQKTQRHNPWGSGGCFQKGNSFI